MIRKKLFKLCIRKKGQEATVQYQHGLKEFNRSLSGYTCYIKHVKGHEVIIKIQLDLMLNVTFDTPKN